MNNDSIDAQLLFAQNALTNAQGNDIIKAKILEYGYDEPKMQTGKTLYDETSRLHTLQKKEYGEQYAATDALGAAYVAADKRYMKDVKLARIVLKGDRSAAAGLQLDGSRKRNLPGWLSQAKAFYTNALSTPAVLAAMAGVGRTEEKLNTAETMVKDVEAKRSIQLKEKGEAQAATEARDYAFDDLNEWMSDFIGIAKIALEDEPQQLEMLGLVTE